MTFRRFMGFTAMAFLWTGSQIPVYLFGTAHPPATCFRSVIDILNQAVFPLLSTGRLVEQTVGFGL
jgi:hypothetical protein